MSDDNLLEASREALYILDRMDVLLGDEWDFGEPCERDDLCGSRFCDEFGCMSDKLAALRAAVSAPKGHQ